MITVLRPALLTARRILRPDTGRGLIALVVLGWGGRAGAHRGCRATGGLILARSPKANPYHLEALPQGFGGDAAFGLVDLLKDVPH